MTLRVFHGPRLGPLGDELVTIMRSPLTDPFAPEVVAVPTAGVRDWLSRHLARALGITANVHFPFPNRFATMALGLVDPTRPSAGDDDPWAVERLTWAVLEVLAHGDVVVPGSTRTAPTDAVESAEAPDAVRSRQYVVARHVADLFDQYATNRPDVLRQWGAGVPGDGTVGADRDLVGALDESMRWQFELFQAVRARIGVPNPAEQFADALDELRAGRREPALPPRVALFGLSTLSSTQLDLLEALGAVCDVGVFLVDPSPTAWDRAAPQPPGRLVPRRRDVDVDDDMPDGHPLLRSWGRLSAETASLVRGHVEPTDVATRMAPAADTALTLLGHVQRDLVLDRAPTPFVGGADGTVQVHACHGALRQLEALRDALDALFVGDPALTPRDVVVMSPDISRFAPFAAAVFERGALPVPVTVSDLTLGAENPVAVALRTIVATLAGRCTASDVLTLAALEPVRRTLGLTAADLERFGHWVDALGTRWGLDPDQRSEWVRGDIVEGTWAATLDRLLLGAAVAVVPATDTVAPSFPADVLPYDDMAADDMRSAGRLAELLARLREARRLLDGNHVVDEWADRLARVLASLCSVAADSAWQLAAVAAAVDELRVRSTIGDTPSAVLLDVREVRAVLDDAIGGARGRLRTRSGDVLLTGLVPLRNVPARVVCLLGLDADSLRPAALDGDDLLARRPCVGERDRRAERRHGLLDAVMAASDHLVVTYDGFDIATDRPLRAAVALVELLDVVTATLGEDAEHAGVVTHHPRRAYDARLFESTSVAPGFDGVMLAAAETRRAPGAGERAWASRFDAPLPLLVSEHVSLEELATACTRPARVLLRDRLGLRLPGRAEDLDVNIPMSPSPLRVAELGRDLLARLIRHPANDRDTVVARWRADARHAGSLAPRRLGEEALTVVEAQVIEMVSALGRSRTLDEGSRAATAIAVDVEIVVDEPDEADGVGGPPPDVVPSLFDRHPVAVRLVDTVDGVTGASVQRARFARPHHRYLVHTALELAALVRTSPGIEWDAVLVTRAASGSSTLTRRLRVVDADHATTLLEVALELRLDALRRRVPLFEAASAAAAATWRPIDEMLLDDDDRGRVHGDLADPETAFVWQQISRAELDRHELQPEELARRLWLAIGRFVTVEEDKSSRSAS